MTNKLFAIAVLLILVCALLFAGCQDQDKGDLDLPRPDASDDAYAPTGPTDDGRVILPSGRAISPVGERVTLRRFPISLAVHPDGDLIYVGSAKDRTLATIDARTMKMIHEIELRNHFDGLAINAAGTKLWAGGGSREKVYEFDLIGGEPVLSREIEAFGYPAGLLLSADERRLYISLAFGKRIAVINLASGLEITSMNTGYYPYAVAVSEELGRVISTNWGTSNVSVFDKGGTLLADIEVGKNPEGVVLGPDQRYAYVACADTDEVFQVDLANLEVARSLPLYTEDQAGFGAFATDIVLTPDGERLLVAASGFNSIDVIDIAQWQVVGRIPTEWYPTAVQAFGDELYVVTAKGVGSGPGGVNDSPGLVLPTDGGNLLGSLEQLDMPDEPTLKQYTQMVQENNRRPAGFYEPDVEFDSPIPSQRGEGSRQIKHVVFILKENKTFDQIMADLPGVDGDQSLLLFGEQYTPNVHALAREFTVCDNYYSESHESDLGHAWATGVVANDYIEKNWAASDWLSLTGVEPATIPATGTVFQKMLEHELDFRIYGEIVGTLPDIEVLAKYMDLNYGFYNMAVSDVTKAQEVLREWKQGIFPQFIMILLPNDHTAGTDPGWPTMEYMVADNDAGLGLLLEWIVNSEYWPETAVFITQDDPQSGVDHVDAHRTPFTLVSPFAKRGYVSNVHYSMASMWLTIELILGLPPLTDYDRFTAPMYDLFQSKAQLPTEFAAIPNSMPLVMNSDELPMTDYCKKQSWDVPDQVERIGEVVWAYMKPGLPYPWHLAVAPSEAEEQEQGEEEKGANYRMMTRAYIEFAVRNGLLDPQHSLAGNREY
ncbi:MAG: bifunctional YncE family protein/alkaline phosphatase family protein [Candidatus Alcyoniella australis]|nr:bifunctional YncE family protein/alkaline phosphatase family protein [Candidatus Alcyoniella australis]